MTTYVPIDECRTVAELLADPARWTQDTWARSANGSVAKWGDKQACKFCMMGAIFRVYGPRYEPAMWRRLHDSLGGSVSQFNDAPERTHAEVLEAVRRAGI